RFIYVPTKGDFEITARLDCMDDIGTLGQAGLMVRDTLDTFSAHAYFNVSTVNAATSGTRLIKGTYRRLTDPTRTSSFTSITDNAVPSLPIWLKLARAGTKISFYRSADGIDYGNPIGERDIGTTGIQINLRDDALAGLAITGGGPGGNVAVTFA